MARLCPRWLVPLTTCAPALHLLPPLQVATNADFNVCREAIDYLTEQIRAIEAKLVAFQALGLPMQLIHGDLHYDNVMVRGAGLLRCTLQAARCRLQAAAACGRRWLPCGMPGPAVRPCSACSQPVR